MENVMITTRTMLVALGDPLPGQNYAKKNTTDIKSSPAYPSIYRNYVQTCPPFRPQDEALKNF